VTIKTAINYSMDPAWNIGCVPWRTSLFKYTVPVPSWSQWPRGLRHELSSLARMLGSWVRIPLKAWMFVCVCIGSGLATGWSPIQGVLPTVLGLSNWSETKRFTDALCSKVGGNRNERDKQVTRDRAFPNSEQQLVDFVHRPVF
jgi:hypothetical protein